MSPVLAGLALGAVFGAAARLGQFCLLRGMKGLFGGGDLSALRAFGLALEVALCGSQALNWFGLTDLSASLPLRGGLPLGGLALGGAIFGFGMVLANACGARSLVLLAGGNLRALLVLLCLGLAAQASLTGILAEARQALQFGPVTTGAVRVSDYLAAFGLTGLSATLVAAGIPSLFLLAFALPLIRHSRTEALMAVIVGLCIVMGWWLAFRTNDPFDPKILNSLSFIAPIGEGVLWLMLSTGRSASFALAIVGGTLAGAFVMALLTRSFTLESFGSGQHTLLAASGGIMMGFGGVLAMGCSIGQSLSGISTLSLASLVGTPGILSGILVGLIFMRQVNPGRN
ncbi:YeeE/YedE family protein [Pseudogemmobacter faecipullorum]|uniref:YeeE/YedE family protein n=1 Tax=Pseudogemmobacter faecipullorum TaxID=2755041 RepID=A0ABS8CL70_9RHOB|nr:YeeE/YedE family protein [Pseudogemmobacter faecipullorum]MCB5410149.1 YeeE/YedE family protein [Pseudogemmobacter faecipullorum]